jgi:predicted nucleotidyltransferase
MNKNRDRKELSAKLQQHLQIFLVDYPMVLSAYLFGSTVEGLASSASDIDVAIRVNETVPAETRFDIRMRLIDDLEKYLGSKIDVVVLNNASLKMINQVLTKGELVFAKDFEQELDYHVRKQKEYFDFKYYIDKDTLETRRYFGVTNGD